MSEDEVECIEEGGTEPTVALLCRPASALNVEKFGKRKRRRVPSRPGDGRGRHGAVGTSQIALMGIARRRGPKERVCCPVYMTRPTMKSSPSR